jgi:hypothetical protein
VSEPVDGWIEDEENGTHFYETRVWEVDTKDEDLVNEKSA